MSKIQENMKTKLRKQQRQLQ